MPSLAAKLLDRYRERRLVEIEQRARLAFLRGADGESRRATGRPLTAGALERVTRGFRDTR